MEELAKAQCERSRAGWILILDLGDSETYTHLWLSPTLAVVGHLRMDGPCDGALLLGLMRLLWKLLSSPPWARAFLGSQGSVSL